MAAWVAPAGGSLPQSTDVGQLVTGLTAAADVGVLSLAAPVSAPATAPTLSTSTSGTAVDNTEWGLVTFVTGVVSASGQLTVAGETPAGPVSSAVTVSNGAIAWSAIPTGPSTVVARRLYRSPAIPNPATALTLTQAAGSTGFTAGEIVYVAYALYNSAGTTTPGSSQASINIATAGNIIGTSVTLPSTASGLWLYVGTASGPLALAQVDASGTITYSGGVTSGLVVSVSGSTLTLTISATASSSGSAPATQNTANTELYGRVATIPNNTQTTWIDNVADSALGATAPTINTTGSTLGGPTSPNLLFNSSAELGLQGWTASASGWTASSWNSGRNAPFFFYTGTTTATLTSLTMKGANIGTPVTVSAQLFNQSASGPSTLTLQALDSSGTVLATVATLSAPAGSSWTWSTATGTLPAANTASLQVVLTAAGTTNASIGFSQIKVEYNTGPTPYSLEADWNLDLYATPIAEALNLTGMHIYDTPGSVTFTVPPGVTRLFVQLWSGGGGGGGGGAGGGSASTGGSTGGGGGGGAWQWSEVFVTSGATITGTVGAGGAGGAGGGAGANGANGHSGGETTFGVLSLGGGGGGGGGLYASTTPGSGGSGAGAGSYVVSVGGGAGIAGGQGGNSGQLSDNGSGASGGSGGLPGASGNDGAPGNDGGSAGGGGGGGGGGENNGGNGGDGGHGLIIVSW